MPTCDLYHFSFADGGDYRYTSAEADIGHGGHVWVAVPLSRSRPEENPTGEITSTSLSIEIDQIEASVVRRYDGAGPTREVAISIYSADRDDIDGTIRRNFSGLIDDISREGKWATFSAVPRLADTQRLGPRGHYSVVCRHRLYGRGCGVDIDSASMVGEVLIADETEREVTVVLDTSLAEDWFVGGHMELDGQGRHIVAQSGPVESGGEFIYTLSIVYWLDDLGAGSGVTVAPGCDHSFQACWSKFANPANFGGFPRLGEQVESPFGLGWRRL